MNIDNIKNLGSDFFSLIFEVIPLPIFIVDEDVAVFSLNSEAQKMLDVDPAQVLYKRGGEVLHCIHSTEVPEGCGRAPACKDCAIRNAVNESFKGGKTHRSRIKAELMSGNKVNEIELLITSAPFTFDDKVLALLILEDITELTALRSIIPICSNCKKIRDDQSYWNSIEDYFSKFLGVDFSHGMCPDCAKKLYPKFYNKSL